MCASGSFAGGRVRFRIVPVAQRAGRPGNSSCRATSEIATTAGFLEAALRGHRVEALLHLGGVANDRDSILATHLLVYDGRCGKHTDAVGPKHLQKRAVLELGHHLGPDPVPLEPLVERSTQG